MALPAALAQGIERIARDADPTQVMRQAQALSARYRDGQGTGTDHGLTRLSAIAYLAARLPATYGALESVFAQWRLVDPSAAPHSLLDVGAGPGTGSWAALEAFPTISRITAVEREAEMVRLGQELAAGGDSPVLRGVCWERVDLMTGVHQPHDVGLLAYTLGEVASDRRGRLIRALWEASQTALIIVEPGTPEGFGRIRDARRHLVNDGAHIMAPCPHDAECPWASGPDWCHFSARIQRSRRHRQLKGGDAPFEDEKFSYLVAVRTPPALRTARVLRHPRSHPGHVALTLCGPDGLSQRTIARSQGDLFRRARKIRWGDGWDGVETDAPN